MESEGAGGATACLNRVLQDLREALPLPGHQGCWPSCSGRKPTLNGAVLNVEVQPHE